MVPKWSQRNAWVWSTSTRRLAKIAVPWLLWKIFIQWARPYLRVQSRRNISLWNSWTSCLRVTRFWPHQNILFYYCVRYRSTGPGESVNTGMEILNEYFPSEYFALHPNRCYFWLKNSVKKPGWHEVISADGPTSDHPYFVGDFERNMPGNLEIAVQMESFSKTSAPWMSWYKI